MEEFATHRPAWAMLFLLVVAASTVGLEPSQAVGAPPLYWCPDLPADQQLAAAPAAGCTPLVEKQEKPQAGTKAGKVPPSIKIENIQIEVTRFLERYRQFLDCCATKVESLDELEDLEEQASELLKSAQTGLFSEQMKLRGFTLHELIPPVARARDQLRGLHKRLDEIAASASKVGTLDYEVAGRERRRIEQEQESIQEEFRPTRPPEAPRTGLEIGVTPSAGPEIGSSAPTGPAIGTTPATGPEIGTTPPTGQEIGQTPPTGFEIGTTGRVGPAIGDSSLNRR